MLQQIGFYFFLSCFLSIWWFPTITKLTNFLLCLNKQGILLQDYALWKETVRNKHLISQDFKIKIVSSGKLPPIEETQELDWPLLSSNLIFFSAGELHEGGFVSLIFTIGKWHRRERSCRAILFFRSIIKFSLFSTLKTTALMIMESRLFPVSQSSWWSHFRQSLTELRTKSWSVLLVPTNDYCFISREMLNDKIIDHLFHANSAPALPSGSKVGIVGGVKCESECI